MPAMNLKPITFRCTTRQLERLHTAMLTDANTPSRTALISDALFAFLDFVENREATKLDLFQLVQEIDALGSQVPFGEQA